MNTDDHADPGGHPLPLGANATDPPVWRWVFVLTQYGFADGWVPVCKVLLLAGLPLGLLIILTITAGPWWTLGTSAAIGGATWLHRRHSTPCGARPGATFTAPRISKRTSPNHQPHPKPR